MPFNVTTSSIEHATRTQQTFCPPPVGTEGRDFEENTMLITETSNGNIEAVKTLLSQTQGRININAQNVYGYTALLVALSNGYAHIAAALLDCGANVHISTLEGLTPLHMAVIHCDEAMVTKIIECGAFLGVQDEEGDSVVHFAVREGREDMLSFLMTKPFSLDVKNEDGETPLHLAASLGEETMVEQMLSHGASHLIKDNDGLTPFEHARSNSHFKVAHILSKGKSGSNLSGSSNQQQRHDPYRRLTCGDTFSDYERKRLLSSQHPLSELQLQLPPANFC